jgi:hypothetical protein
MTPNGCVLLPVSFRVAPPRQEGGSLLRLGIFAGLPCGRGRPVFQSSFLSKNYRCFWSLVNTIVLSIRVLATRWGDYSLSRRKQVIPCLRIAPDHAHRSDANQRQRRAGVVQVQVVERAVGPFGEKRIEQRRRIVNDFRKVPQFLAVIAGNSQNDLCICPELSSPRCPTSATTSGTPASVLNSIGIAVWSFRSRPIPTPQAQASAREPPQSPPGRPEQPY